MEKSLDEQKELALKLVNSLFSKKLDKAGISYLEHLYTVSDALSSEKEKIVGLLHDTLEDTDVTYNELLELGFSKEIVEAIDILTKKENISYEEYIDNIVKSNNLLAINVKISDLEHNMDISRINNPNEEDYKRLDKYKSAYTKLKNIEKEGK